MKWFKFYGQDYLSDPKMLALTACERSCWITLLSYASVNDNGMITFLSEEQLMSQAGLDLQKEEWKETKGVLERLKKFKMIHIDNGMITVINWQKRQETSLTSYERVKRYREKKRSDNANDNAKITTDKIRVDKNRRDKNIILHSEQSSQINKSIELFKPLNPLNYKKWYSNKTQRAAIGRLIKALGDKLEISINTAVQANEIKYAPTITTPLQLEEKLSALRSFVAKEKKTGIQSL